MPPEVWTHYPHLIAFRESEIKRRGPIIEHCFLTGQDLLLCSCKVRQKVKSAHARMMNHAS